MLIAKTTIKIKEKINYSINKENVFQVETSLYSISGGIKKLSLFVGHLVMLASKRLLQNLDRNTEGLE